MTEVIQNSSASTLNGTINNVVTSLTVANGAVFPATGNFRILIDSELMLCTARASNVLTVTRGVETTTGASHTTGAAVTHVLTTTALANYIAEHSVAQTIIDAKGDLVAGTAADTMVRKAVGADKTLLMADSSQSDGLLWAGSWTTYTPTWGSTGTAPALGNGTLTGRYVQLGKTVHGQIVLTPGSSTTFGTGSWSFSFPVTASASCVGPIGLVTAIDASPLNGYDGIFRLNITTNGFIDTFAQPFVNWGPTVPITWAVSDTAQIRFTYEAA